MARTCAVVLTWFCCSAAVAEEPIGWTPSLCLTCPMPLSPSAAALYARGRAMRTAGSLVAALGLFAVIASGIVAGLDPNSPSHTYHTHFGLTIPVGPNQGPAPPPSPSDASCGGLSPMVSLLAIAGSVAVLTGVPIAAAGEVNMERAKRTWWGAPAVW
jgi:hypothetical protein